MSPLDQTYNDGTRHYDNEYDPDTDFAEGARKEHVEKLARMKR